MTPVRDDQKHRYPRDWDVISRYIRFERAKGQCECLGECGRGTHEGRCPNEHRKPAYGTGSLVILTTAHLDHTPENNDPTNLRAMCQACHLHYDRDHHAETRKTKQAVTAHPQRIQRKRTKGWKMPPNTVYVGRPSKWGNPISLMEVGEQFPSLDDEVVARLVVRDFRALAIRGRLFLPNWRFLGGSRGPVEWTYPPLSEIRAELAGKDLACWCPPVEACHADVLLDLANERTVAP